MAYGFEVRDSNGQVQIREHDRISMIMWAGTVEDNTIINFYTETGQNFDPQTDMIAIMPEDANAPHAYTRSGNTITFVDWGDVYTDSNGDSVGSGWYSYAVIWRS